MGWGGVGEEEVQRVPGLVWLDVSDVLPKPPSAQDVYSMRLSAAQPALSPLAFWLAPSFSLERARG